MSREREMTAKAIVFEVKKLFSRYVPANCEPDHNSIVPQNVHERKCFIFSNRAGS